VNSKNTFVFAAILGHESLTVSFGVSTRFRLSFWRSFSECLILVRTNLHGVNILLSMHGKRKQKSLSKFQPSQNRKVLLRFHTVRRRGYQRIFNECLIFGRTNLNEINILLPNVNCKKAFVFVAILGHESLTVSLEVSTRFRLSFWRSFNECLILVRTNLYGLNILLSMHGKRKQKSLYKFQPSQNRKVLLGFDIVRRRGYQRIFNECFIFGRTNLNEINISHSNVNSKNTFVFAAILGNESLTVSFGFSTRFLLSFWRSFSECLILVRTNLYGVNILLSMHGKRKQKSLSKFQPSQNRKVLLGYHIVRRRGYQRIFNECLIFG
jgi:hypothetical protein